MFKNKLPSVEDPGQTDRLTILANHVTLGLDLDFQFPVALSNSFV